MKTMTAAILFVVFAGQLPSSARAEKSDAPDAEELLKSSDRARGAAASLQGMTWHSSIVANENGEKSEIAYLVKVRGNDAVAETLSPARQKGELVLFNDRTLWYYKPGLRKPVAVSPRQKLMGQAANGDIASTNYSRDYEATSVEADKVGETPAWRLELKAKAKNVTYDRIRYWVSQKERRALKAEFLTLSGESFKIAEFKYGNSVKLKGEELPFVSETTIRDTANPGNVTTITYKEPKEEAHPAGLFNVNNLIK